MKNILLICVLSLLAISCVTIKKDNETDVIYLISDNNVKMKQQYIFNNCDNDFLIETYKGVDDLISKVNVSFFNDIITIKDVYFKGEDTLPDNIINVDSLSDDKILVRYNVESKTGGKYYYDLKYSHLEKKIYINIDTNERYKIKKGANGNQDEIYLLGESGKTEFIVKYNFKYNIVRINNN